MTDKPRTSSASLVTSPQEKWIVRKVETFPEKWEHTAADFARGDESSVIIPVSPYLVLLS